MNIDVKLLLKHMQAPYVPTLGVVHPLTLALAIDGALSVAQTDHFLPYDKDRRWYPTKNEHILLDSIYQDNAQTIIPTLTGGIHSLLKYHCYSSEKHNAEILQNLQSTLSKMIPEASTQILQFSREPDLKYSSLVFLAEIDDIKIIPPTNISLLGDLPALVGQSLENLANNDPDNSGFSFIGERINYGFDDGDILVSVENNVIIGAIGPLKTMQDAIGRSTIFPPYFGVLKSARNKGIGTSLWNAALSWAKDRGTEYIILQAEHRSPAEYFYHKMGLKELGGIIRS